jgi:hypothetical protein
MATIEFGGVYINLASDLSQSVYIDSVAVSATNARTGTVRAYAGGRLRAFTRSSEPKSVNLSLSYVSMADRETLESWVGELVHYRDGRGRLLYGVYLDMNAQEIRGAHGRSDIALTINAVSHDIEV